jgi:undecaprenyl-diphosphatase
MMHWLQGQDLALCRLANSRTPPACVAALRFVSRLGDGALWLAHVALLWLVAGGGAALRLGSGLLVATILYAVTKRVSRRSRPFAAHPDIRLLAEPLDRFSFPSGHTLHAVVTLLVSAAWHPPSAIWLAPLAVLTALSRVVLGLHYPSDVLGGAGVGVFVAVLVLVA